MKSVYKKQDFLYNDGKSQLYRENANRRDTAMRKSLLATEQKKNRKKHWWLWGTLVVLLCFIAYGTVTAINIFNSTQATYQPLPDRPKSEKREVKVSIKNYDPISILLLGVDQRPGDPGRTDTIMVATINPEKENMILFSIPRDTYVDITGEGNYDKINHAYAFGGLELTINAVENFLDIPIDYYAEINMEGFKDVIDTIGGVEVDVPFSFESSGVAFTEGPMFMDSKMAMAYVQMRKKDPRGDFGRNDRQQQVVKAILQQSLTVSNFGKLDDVIKSVGSNLKTNVAPSDYFSLQEIYRKIDTNEIESFQLEGEGTLLDGIYYYVIDDEEKTRVSQTLKEHLNIDSQMTQR